MSVTSVGRQLACTHHTEQTCGPGPVPPDSAQLAQHDGPFTHLWVSPQSFLSLSGRQLVQPFGPLRLWLPETQSTWSPSSPRTFLGERRQSPACISLSREKNFPCC